jgi:hypothetical protein
MNPTVHWLDEYCNAKLTSPSYGKLLNALIKEYKINLDRYITSTTALIDRDDGYNNYAVDLPDTYIVKLFENGMPFYYMAVIAALSKQIGDRVDINLNATFGSGAVALMRSNKNGKYLCAFVHELDDDTDNNGFFVWSDSIDTAEFASLNKSNVQQMSKQTTLRAGIDLLLN